LYTASEKQWAAFTVATLERRAARAACYLLHDFLIPWESYSVGFISNLRMIPEVLPDLDGELLIVAKGLFHILSIEGEYLLAISFREESLIFP
jgi:hypothetical protein